jgi:hypothetical protein
MVQDVEELFRDFDAILRPVLFSLPDIHMPEEHFSEELQRFNQSVTEL